MRVTGAVATDRATRATMLVVDDVDTIREVLAVARHFGGYTAIEARCGAQDLDPTRTGKPELVLLDIMLPDLDGFAVFQALHPAGDTVPVFFVSARDDPDDRQAAAAGDLMMKLLSLLDATRRIAAVRHRRRDSD